MQVREFIRRIATVFSMMAVQTRPPTQSKYFIKAAAIKELIIPYSYVS